MTCTLKEFDPYKNFGFLTDRVSRLINARVDKVIVEKGFSFPNSCMGILADLWVKDGIRQQDLADALIRNKSSINKMLLALEKDSLIERKIDENDKRQNRIYLTKKGKAFKSFVAKRACIGEKLATAGASEHEIDITRNVLKRMYDNLQLDYNKITE